jgi:hypothetical protein
MRHHAMGPSTAGGKGGHGAAKPEGVIHRYIFNNLKKGMKPVSNSTVIY